MDPTTVIAILALNLLCAAGLFLIIGRRLAPRQGLGLFSAGTGLFGMAYVVRLLLGLDSATAWALVPDTMMVGGSLLLIGGLRQQVGRDSGHWLWLAGALAGFVVIQALATSISGPWGRHVWLNLALGAVYSVLAGEALHEARHGPRVLRPPLLLMAALMAGLASLTLARSLWVGFTGTGQLFSGWPAQLYYGYALLVALLLPACLQWMVFSRLNQQLAETGRRDSLTGVLNRAGLAEAVDRHWGTRPPRPLVLMQIDIDHFKAVNDEHGHAIGDQVLQQVAKTLAAGMRSGDVMARVGGEEFLAVCVDLQPMAARAMAERLRESVAQLAVPIASTLRNLSVTASIGVSRPCETSESFNAAWQEADQALYAAKQAGRDRVRMVSSLHEVQVEPPSHLQVPAAASRPMPLAPAAAAASSVPRTVPRTVPEARASDVSEQDTTPDGLLLNLPEHSRAAD